MLGNLTGQKPQKVFVIPPKQSFRGFDSAEVDEATVNAICFNRDESALKTEYDDPLLAAFYMKMFQQRKFDVFLEDPYCWVCQSIQDEYSEAYSKGQLAKIDTQLDVHHADHYIEQISGINKDNEFRAYIPKLFNPTLRNYIPYDQLSMVLYLYVTYPNMKLVRVINKWLQKYVESDPGKGSPPVTAHMLDTYVGTLLILRGVQPVPVQENVKWNEIMRLAEFAPNSVTLSQAVTSDDYQYGNLIGLLDSGFSFREALKMQSNMSSTFLEGLLK